MGWGCTCRATGRRYRGRPPSVELPAWVESHYREVQPGAPPVTGSSSVVEGMAHPPAKPSRPWGLVAVGVVVTVLGAVGGALYVWRTASPVVVLQSALRVVEQQGQPPVVQQPAQAAHPEVPQPAPVQVAGPASAQVHPPLQPIPVMRVAPAARAPSAPLTTLRTGSKNRRKAR